MTEPFINRTHYFGACPECGETSGYMNVGRSHWFVCDTHQVKWCAGENLFSDWRSEDESIWEANMQKLVAYRDVAPLRYVED